MTFNDPWIDPRVETVRAAAVQEYFRQHGWKQKPYPRPQVLWFEGPLADDGEPIVQMVPADERPRDYLPTIVALITNLAILEERPAVDVLNDILQIAANGQVVRSAKQKVARPSTSSRSAANKA